MKNLFKNQELLNLAFTHKSWVNEHAGSKQSNERLEFLGDAVLEFVVSKELYQKLPTKEEGFLTALRANLVNTVHLAQVAQRLKVGKYLHLSKGEEDTGGRENPSLLADTVEAVIGALFLDQGLSAAEEFIKKNILNDLDKMLTSPLKDSKSALQEKVQAKGLPAPKYTVIKEEGPDHNKIFNIQVLIDNKPAAVGVGKNKSEAAQDAASKALESLQLD